MESFSLPDQLNAASRLVDAHLQAGRGAKAAILAGDACISYAQLAEQVNRLGNALLNLQTRMEERVAILLPDSPECVYAFFGAMKIGAVSIPLNTSLKPKDYAYLLTDSRARVLVVSAELFQRVAPVFGDLRHLKHVIVVGGGAKGDGANQGGGAAVHAFEALTAAASPVLEAAETCKDDAAFWLYSSGTTGFPKGAVHLHHDMLVAAEYYARQTIGLEEADVSFSVAKLFFAYGLGNGLYFPFYVGATTILLADRPTPENVRAVVERYRPSVLYSVPTNYAALLHLAEQTGWTSLDRVRMCISAGEPLPKHLFDKWQERFGVEIYDGIGSTEILHIFISNRPGAVRPGSTGQIVPGYEGKVLDEEGGRMPARQVGTLWIRGDSIATGYWNKHELNKGTFVGDWINTHDKFLVDEDGYYWYAGRTDDMIKVSGQAVWPTEVEGLLQQHPAVLESGVVGTADPDGLIKPVAYVVLKSPHQPSPALAHELQEHVKRSTAPHKYPRAVVFVDSLPKTVTGKIQRFRLRERAAEETPLHGE